jgi:two-component system KDP operon response regulator KdpE
MQSFQAAREKTTVSIDSDGERYVNEYQSEIEGLRHENKSLKDRLTNLTEASNRITQVLDIETLLGEVVNSASSLIGARYAVLLTYDESGMVERTVTSGLTQEQQEQIEAPPKGRGLLGYLNEIASPLRVGDISAHPESVGFPANHPPMNSFLGMQIRHNGEHLGNIFLTEKEGGQEFTQEDEDVLLMFSSLAAHAISNARQYQEMKLAKADLETLINISPIGVAVFDAKTAKMVSTNREARRISGNLDWPDRSRQALVEMLSFRRADGRSMSLSELPTSRVLQSGEVVRAEEMVIEFPDGRSVNTLVNAAPIYSDNGEITTVVITVQDITPLEDLEKLRAEFLGMVSQELRSPLTTIKGSAGALQEILDSSSGTETSHLLKIIDQQTDLMRSQINSLIDLTQIESGSVSVSTEITSVWELVERARQEFQRTHASITIETDIPFDVPMVAADRERMNQVLKNLFSEISNHSQRRVEIRISVTLVDIYVAVSVSSYNASAPWEEPDLLTAIDREEHQETAEEFPQAEGLAIAFCRGIVEAHGGRMTAVHGNHGQGSMFTFTLPSADEAVRTAQYEGEVVKEFDTYTGTSKAKILVAVPDARTLGVVRRILSTSDYSVVETYDSNELDSLTSDERPHMVLLDLSIGMGNGFRLVRHLSQEYNVPVIVISDKGDDENVARAFDSGADDYVVKPFSPTELMVRIKSSLRKRATPRNSVSSPRYEFRNVLLDYSARTLRISGVLVQLTATEYKLLHELSSNSGQILTQDELLQRVWGQEYTGEPQLLRSYVKSLRQKLGDNARNPTFIFTEHGIGYRMAKP